MPQPHILHHPLLSHKLTLLRNKHTNTKEFRETVNEISQLLCYEATRDLPLCETEIETPLAKMNAPVLQGKSVVLVPVLRAGLGMVEGFLQLIPNAKVGHIGLYRDHETLQAVQYYGKFPTDLAQRPVFLLDPMLATGGSASAAITLLKKEGVSNLKFLCILATPEGLALLQQEHSDVAVITCALDERLNEYGYILPGLGDAGDRIFGTN